MKCEECKSEVSQLYHCNCGKWVCPSCGWKKHGWNILSSVGWETCPTLRTTDAETLSNSDGFAFPYFDK